MLKPFRQARNKKANTYDMLNQILFTNRCDDYELFKEKIQYFLLLSCFADVFIVHYSNILFSESI